ncbi:hypothetical protein U6M95_12485 [Cutibacterium acnes]
MLQVVSDDEDEEEEAEVVSKKLRVGKAGPTNGDVVQMIEGLQKSFETRIGVLVDIFNEGFRLMGIRIDDRSTQGRFRN